VLVSKRVAVLGAGGHGKVVADVARCAGVEVVAFVDDAPAKAGTSIWGIPVVAWDRFLADESSRGAAIALAFGDNRARQRSVERVRAAGRDVATLVHPTAAVARTARLGAGTVVMAGAAVNPDALVGEGCIVNTGAVVEHDCVIGNFAHLSPNAALGGGVKVGARTHLGLGAVTLPLVQIGADVRVGAGAVVHRDVADGLTIVGVPAEPLKEK
jgi:sugar O-acyltransferase (sialic acid O-acetyltransferase NeuD family)